MFFSVPVRAHCGVMAAMKPSSYSGLGAALVLVIGWWGVSVAGAALMGRMGMVSGLVGSLAVLALILVALWGGTQWCARRVAVPEVPLMHRWGILAVGFLLTAGSWAALRFGLPFRLCWEALSTCGQILVVAVAAGYLPRFLKSPAELLPLVSVMVCADAVSYLVGPTHHIAQDVAAYYTGGRQGLFPLYEVLLMKFPSPGTHALYPFFGVADWFMVVFLGSASRFFILGDRVAGIPAAVLGLFLAVAAAWLLGVFVPALPVLALFYLAVMGMRHTAVFKPGRREVALAAFPPLVSVALLFIKG
ncbi:hypothetical protein SAMN05216233_12250 [Desulfoluna spongiiphila]|uniref:Uncharacterized protein n=2 Tax=Desulfoluna spongiiphila TaxID=419481 RepID=A0A1G5IUY8_9BACT|nr:hypothetical protein SAMN05216233_12250 [Desulfoluna spongiiphila]